MNTREEIEQAIADRGAALYDKFAGFVEDLGRVGEALKRAQNAHDDALRKLSTGPGNLARQAEMLGPDAEDGGAGTLAVEPVPAERDVDAVRDEAPDAPRDFLGRVQHRAGLPARRHPHRPSRAAKRPQAKKAAARKG